MENIGGVKNDRIPIRFRDMFCRYGVEPLAELGRFMIAMHDHASDRQRRFLPGSPGFVEIYYPHEFMPK